MIFVDIAVAWKRVDNKLLHVCTYLSSLFILVRSKFERNGTGQQISFYVMMVITNGLLVWAVVFPPTLGSVVDGLNCMCHISNCDNNDTIINNKSLIVRWWGSDPFTDTNFTIVIPVVIFSSFLTGITVLINYLYSAHPWKHIIATVPRFEKKKSSTFTVIFVLGTCVASACAVISFGFLAYLCYTAYPTNRFHGMAYFFFPYVIAFSGFGLYLYSFFSTIDKKKALVRRPNYILTCLINVFKVMGIQGCILISILEFYLDWQSSQASLVKWAFIIFAAVGCFITVLLYYTSSMTGKTWASYGLPAFVSQNLGNLWREWEPSDMDINLSRYSPLGFVREQKSRKALPKITIPASQKLTADTPVPKIPAYSTPKKMKVIKQEKKQKDGSKSEKKILPADSKKLVPDSLVIEPPKAMVKTTEKPKPEPMVKQIPIAPKDKDSNSHPSQNVKKPTLTSSKNLQKIHEMTKLKVPKPEPNTPSKSQNPKVPPVVLQRAQLRPSSQPKPLPVQHPPLKPPPQKSNVYPPSSRHPPPNLDRQHPSPSRPPPSRRPGHPRP